MRRYILIDPEFKSVSYLGMFENSFSSYLKKSIDTDTKLDNDDQIFKISNTQDAEFFSVRDSGPIQGRSLIVGANWSDTKSFVEQIEPLVNFSWSKDGQGRPKRDEMGFADLEFRPESERNSELVEVGRYTGVPAEFNGSLQISSELMTLGDERLLAFTDGHNQRPYPFLMIDLKNKRVDFSTLKEELNWTLIGSERRLYLKIPLGLSADRFRLAFCDNSELMSSLTSIVATAESGITTLTNSYNLLQKSFIKTCQR
ncbi:hypothetical protein G3T14_21120 [Methylobacterium sp. BTF04]|uniref:hypothetical protein n=1 Tax=Methylobacterium sp. BTF04 TaxID=2708300 RepID=UPI0013D73649|nr:hypothetical protein [Methylobacterium sp. BTF04]NEU14594.1 hypothetical protein [Methylobacterium sp. BTF04]